MPPQAIRHIYELRNHVDHDDMELGIRVACALYLENVNQDGFLILLGLRHHWGCGLSRKRGES